MPLPKNFYNTENKRVSLERLCKEEPGWAANRIRYLTKINDDLQQNFMSKTDSKNSAVLEGTNYHIKYIDAFTINLTRVC